MLKGNIFDGITLERIADDFDDIKFFIDTDLRHVGSEQTVSYRLIEELSNNVYLGIRTSIFNDGTRTLRVPVRFEISVNTLYMTAFSYTAMSYPTLIYEYNPRTFNIEYKGVMNV